MAKHRNRSWGIPWGIVGLLVGLCSGASEVALAQGEACVGEPFGVGMVSLTLPAAESAAVSEVNGFALDETNGRAVYPVFTEGRILRLLGEFLPDGLPLAPPNTLSVLFLFTGDQPLDLIVHAPTPTRYRLTPRRPRNPRVHARLLQRWWREYSAAARQQARDGDYPPIVQTYLMSMFSRRLGLQPVLLDRVAEPPASQPTEVFELLTGAETLRVQTLRETNLTGHPTAEPADQPVPAPIDWRPLPAPEAEAAVEIEPIAMRVPEECFYIRFGTFTNYLWVDNLQREYGGDLEHMIALRGFDDGTSTRIEQQLALSSSPLADLLGPTVIADVALIGRDLFLREGAAVGMLFQARNALLLGRDLTGQREAAFKAERAHGATLETVQIGGRKVSFLSTPDNRLRSYYLADGDYHLVTTSRAIVERFIEVRDGPGSLGASREFRHARAVMPTSRQDTVFAFFSSACQQGLVSPQYQIELRRRLQTVTNVELLRLALWAARVENSSANTIDTLIQGGFLPPGFGREPGDRDPTETRRRLVESLDQSRASMTPIPDVVLDGVTASEARRFAELARYAANTWPQMDPLIVGVRRVAGDGPGRERLLIDARLSPFAQQKYGWVASLLGPPTHDLVSPAADDIVTLQAFVTGGSRFPLIPAHHLLVGIRDSAPVEHADDGLLPLLRSLQGIPGYLAAWPKPGFLDLLPFNLGGSATDAAGYSQLPLGVYRRQWDDFSALALDPQLLAEVTPQLAVAKGEDLAQVRIHVGDLSAAQAQGWVDSWAYRRAKQASIGNVKLLHALSQQLGVPREQALQAAETLLDANLVCSLGGTYNLTQVAGQIPMWASDRWADPDAAPAAEYCAPLLKWFRGLDTQLTMHDDRVELHATLDMQRKASEPKLGLPLFQNLFGGGSKAADQAKPAEKAKPADQAPPAAPAPATRRPPPPAAEIIPPPPGETEP